MSPKDTGGAVPKFPKRADFGADARVRQVAETEKYIFTDPSDGMEYEYSEDNSAWFPVWNAQLVEQQQSAYGKAEEAEPAADRGKKRRTERPARARRENTAVYVSGLPKDTTEKEVAEFFAQCGAILPDLLTSKLLFLYVNVCAWQR
ncbi:hypothetical protein EC988_004635 [Linderina pennispora]|nr:hypothetical protein EC988_004635 [Linderina pennispora]